MLVSRGMSHPRIAFVSREVYPFDAAGLGNYVAFTAAALADHAEVTILTTSMHEQRYHELAAAHDPRLPDGVRFEFVREPTGPEAVSWYGLLHLWAARAFESLVQVYPDGGPHLVEFPDYFGEGCVTAQAVQTVDRRIRHTTVCVRAYTTAEICAVLDGFMPTDRDPQLAFDLERYAIRHTDHFLWPGGDVLDTYRRFYGETAIAAPVQVPHTVNVEADGGPPVAGDETRFLYVGRFERRKGVQNLIRAATAMPREGWSLTLIGGDTETAPLGTSMRDQLELMVAGDPRIRLLGRVARADLSKHYEAADAVVSPSLWECWPNTVLEAYAHGRPVLATPVGGHVEMVESGRTGWLAEDTDPEALAEVMERAIESKPTGADTAAIRARFNQLTDPEPVRESYVELAAGVRRPARRPRPEPLVSVVVPYYRMGRFVDEALASVRDQSHRRIEIVLVNDGSLWAEDEAIADVAERYRCRVVTQQNSGLGQARNLGLDVARGRYVLPFDPDDVLMPSFVAKCVDALERRPELAYVTAWSLYINEDGSPAEGGYRPLGNGSGYLPNENVAGSAMSIFRRRLFERGLRYSPDMTSYEDWLLFMQLAAAGGRGHVIPENLLLYRVRERSMLREIALERRERLRGELDAHVREAGMEWTVSSA
jgi:glycogen synthase